jgi:hypothetical protein
MCSVKIEWLPRVYDGTQLKMTDHTILNMPADLVFEGVPRMLSDYLQYSLHCLMKDRHCFPPAVWIIVQMYFSKGCSNDDEKKDHRDTLESVGYVILGNKIIYGNTTINMKFSD